MSPFRVDLFNFKESHEILGIISANVVYGITESAMNAYEFYSAELKKKPHF